MAGRDVPTDDASNGSALDEAEALRLDAIAKAELEEAGEEFAPEESS